MTFGEDTFVEQDAPAVHVMRGRPTVLSVALQITDWLVGVGDVNHLTTVRALQINRHAPMIDRETVDSPGSQAPHTRDGPPHKGESHSPDPLGPWTLRRPCRRRTITS